MLWIIQSILLCEESDKKKVLTKLNLLRVIEKNLILSEWLKAKIVW